MICQYAILSFSISRNRAPVPERKTQLAGMMQEIHLFQNNDAAKSKADANHQLNNYRSFTEQFFIASAD
jgi:hypothetical protein